MKNKRLNSIIIFSLAIASSLSIVGSAFALWTFNEDTSTSSNVSIELTNSYDYGTYHVHSPNFFILESDMSDISTYGGLAFYTGGSVSDHFGNVNESDDEKLYASVMIGLSDYDENVNPSYLKFTMDIYLNGFIKDIIGFDSTSDPDGIIDSSADSSNNGYIGSYEFSNFKEINIENDNGELTKQLQSEAYCLDGRFIYNSTFDDLYRNSDGSIKLNELKEDSQNNIGSISLKISFTPSEN